ncbi:hypothetical protein P879_04345 [Paragonimus westermani]|uniref:Uncharacterized protein n=1 Tax=Paragonimus westermani TaxID=34504 RepID=A0A8T0D730_9TREM|nr:hypothetical protein P879_04345 [Paragonimus westermani]
MNQYTEQDAVGTESQLSDMKYLSGTDSNFLLDSEDERTTGRRFLINPLLDAESNVLTHTSSVDLRSDREAPQFDGSHIPPLDLCSRDSSVTDSNDALKGTLDIDFREGNEHENYLAFSLNGDHPAVIEVIAHNLTVVEDHDKHKMDFVEANKDLRNLGAPKYSGSYGLLHKTKTNFGIRDPSSAIHSESMHGHFLPSRSGYLTHCMPRLYSRSGHERSMDFDHQQPYSSPELCNTYPVVLGMVPNATHKTTEFAGLQPPACSWFTSPSNIPVYTESLNPQRRRYASAERLGQTVQKFPQPVSASGVFRMGLQQQVNLIQAHQEFLRSKVTPAKQQKQERVIQPSWFCSHENISHKPSSSRTEPYISKINHQIHPLSISLLRNQQPLRTDDNLHGPKIRYTLKDYALLPRIQTQSRGLGPDLESEEYKIKLTKYQRQHGYAELLRKQAIKRQKNLSRKLVLPRAQSNPCNTIIDGSTVNTEYDVDDSEQTSDPSVAVTDSSRTLTNREVQQEVYSDLAKRPVSHSNSLEGQNKLNKPNFTTSCFSLDERDLTEKEVQRQEANRKREAMLCYARRIRSNFVKQRKQTSCSVGNELLSSNHGGSEAVQCAPKKSSNEPTYPHLSELLRRHEDDRKQADAIRKSLKVVL